jgi:tetratricopeptide (TPR) repeat protein
MSDKVYPGDEFFDQALRLCINDNDTAEEENTLFLKAINKGLALDDEWLAYNFLGSGYLEVSDDQRALSAYRKAFALIDKVSKEKLSDQKDLLKASKQKCGILFCIKGVEQEEASEYFDAQATYEEAVKLTDHPIAHEKLVRLYEIFSGVKNKTENLKKAVYHNDYIINNETQLEHFPKYQEVLAYAKEKKSSLSKELGAATTGHKVKIIVGVIIAFMILRLIGCH